MQFPQQFVWGVATAAYQIEGAVREGGRGESIWDRFCATPGKIFNRESGKVACDHYHRYPEDIGLVRELGVKAYRFSIAWPRILSEGRGQINPAGLDFYERLVDMLLDNGIEPFVTLYHWDLPQALQDQVGGWGSRETSLAFANYADVVSRRLGDRVKYWITLNEPSVSTFRGHEGGQHAPGLKDSRLAYQVAHHLLLGHGLALPILRQNGKPDTQVGITLVMTDYQPATDRSEDQDAFQLADARENRLFLDPLFRSAYPSILLDRLGQAAPQVQGDDLEKISAPIDFLGVNYYTRWLVEKSGSSSISNLFSIKAPPVPRSELTEMGWEVYPRGLHTILTRLHTEYKVPAIYITENGAAFPDKVDANGQVHDPRRVAYLRDHLEQAGQALTEGVPLNGYFAWSLMDNFEWAFGYSKRFGLIYVDYTNQRRIIKDSGRWYQETVRSGNVDH